MHFDGSSDNILGDSRGLGKKRMHGRFLGNKEGRGNRENELLCYLGYLLFHQPANSPPVQWDANDTSHIAGFFPIEVVWYNEPLRVGPPPRIPRRPAARVPARKGRVDSYLPLALGHDNWIRAVKAGAHAVTSKAIFLRVNIERILNSGLSSPLFAQRRIVDAPTVEFAFRFFSLADADRI